MCFLMFMKGLGCPWGGGEKGWRVHRGFCCQYLLQVEPGDKPGGDGSIGPKPCAGGPFPLVLPSGKPLLPPCPVLALQQQVLDRQDVLGAARGGRA